MAHTIYQTEGIILNKKDFGEADRMFNIFTEKFGMINAVAQGARYLKSKLRYNLDLFSYGNFSLIAAKEFWRIIDAEETMNNRDMTVDPKKADVFLKISNLLIRMIKGEEKNEFVWQEVKKFFLYLREKDIGKERLKDLEIITMARILNNLGYMARIPESKKEMISAINKALKESML